jgi:uncharacterized membrane protein YfcA
MSSNDLLILSGIGLVSFALSFIGAAVGMVLGHLRLPLLVAFLGSPVSGASTNLGVSGLGALAGAVRHFRGGRVSLVALALVGIPSAVGAAVGMLLFVKVNRFWAHITLGFLLLVLGIRIVRRPVEQQKGADSLPGKWQFLGEILVGLLLGALAAVTGLMMNGLRLPVLVRLLRGDVPVAIGSNMAIGLLTALVGVGAAWIVDSGFDLLCLAIVGPPTILGSYLGAAVTGRMRKETLQRVLGWVIAILGLLMVLEAFWRASRPRDLQPPPHTPAEVRELEEETDEWLVEPDWAR